MEKVPSDKTVQLIFDHLSEIDKTLPLSESDIDDILEYFECLESSLSNSQAIGESIDNNLLNSASDCVDEIAIYEDDEYLDLEKLNQRLNSLIQKHSD